MPSAGRGGFRPAARGGDVDQPSRGGVRCSRPRCPCHATDARASAAPSDGPPFPRKQEDGSRGGSLRPAGRLDGRFGDIDPDAAGETPDEDATRDAGTGACLAAFNQYVATARKFSEDCSQLPNNDAVINRGWDWKHKQGRGFGFTLAPYVGSDLAEAMRRAATLT
jgi:hypothetical protein